MELPSEVFALALHPTQPLIATGLLEGHVSCYSFDLTGNIMVEKKWHTKRHKLSCRGLEFSPDGAQIVSVGKDGVIKIADSETGKVTAKDMEAHTDAIDAVKYMNENIFVTGDDIGVVKTWDTRTLKPVQTYPDTHTDHITSFLPLPHINPHHVLCTSGDCTLSVFDVRKQAAIATSEDQEDELLCSSFADDSRRICIGTQSGIVTLWRSGEWEDHVDRIAPAEKLRKGDEAPSVDCMVALENEVLVGTADGKIRPLRFRPNQYGKLVGQCEDGVTALAVVPNEERWIVSAAGTKVQFWNTNDEGQEDDEESSDEEEKRKKKRKKGKGGKVKPSENSSGAFFADL